MVFSDTLFFLQLLWLHHISGKAACWESSESSVQKLVLLFTIHQLGIFSSRTLVPSLPFHLFQKLNKELLPREESPQAPKMKMVPRRVLMVKPSLLQTELWNAIWKLSLSLRQQDFVSWKGIPFSLWKLVIDGSKFTQVYSEKSLLPVYFPHPARRSNGKAEPRNSEMSRRQSLLCWGVYIK